MRFVGALVVRKTRVTVDPEHRSSRWARVGNQMRRNLIEWDREIGNKSQDRLTHIVLPLFLMGLEPVTFVVAFEAGEKLEKLRGEIRGHGT
jgi:hypothetical protein